MQEAAENFEVEGCFVFLNIFKCADLRISIEISIVDGFNQLLRHLYYLLFTSCEKNNPAHMTDA